MWLSTLMILLWIASSIPQHQGFCLLFVCMMFSRKLIECVHLNAIQFLNKAKPNQCARVILLNYQVTTDLMHRTKHKPTWSSCQWQRISSFDSWTCNCRSVSNIRFCLISIAYQSFRCTLCSGSTLWILKWCNVCNSIPNKLVNVVLNYFLTL